MQPLLLQPRDRRSTQLPLIERKQRLKQRFSPKPRHTLLVVDAIPEAGIELYAMAVELKLEGCVPRRPIPSTCPGSAPRPGEKSRFRGRCRRKGFAELHEPSKRNFAIRRVSARRTDGRLAQGVQARSCAARAFQVRLSRRWILGGAYDSLCSTALCSPPASAKYARKAPEQEHV